MRILGLDLGQVRIGVALSDPSATIAQALEVIPNDGFRQVLGRLRLLIAQHGVDRIVVGLPLRMDGREGEEAAAVRAFAVKLQGAVAIPVEMADERLSTAAAEKTMIEAGARREQRRSSRDAVAAALMLQTHLDRANARGSPGTMTEPHGVFTLLDERGRPEDFRLVDVIEVDQQRYALLQPVAATAGAAVVFRVVNDTLVALDDDAELERVIDALEDTESYDDIVVLDG